jgi:hypothetical protein
MRTGKRNRFKGRGAWRDIVAALVLLIVISSSAPAHGAGVWDKFAACPLEDPETFVCLYARSLYETEAKWARPKGRSELAVGTIQIGFRRAVIVQGGLRESTLFAGAEQLIDPTGGSPAIVPIRQPIRGGLRFLVDPAQLPGPARRSLDAVLRSAESRRVWAVIESAPAAPTIMLSASNMLAGSGTGLALAVKVHLENAFLGTGCYAGSDLDPIVLDLTTGSTAPPPPTEPVDGQPGSLKAFARGAFAGITEDSLADNAFAVPGVSGCGKPPWQGRIDAAINTSLGLPSQAGHNAARINGTLYLASSERVKEHLARQTASASRR